MTSSLLSERALVLAPRGRDAAIAVAMLAEAEAPAQAVPSIEALVAELDVGAGLVVVTEEALATADLTALTGWIAGQPGWSDLPFLLLTRHGGGLERNPEALRYLDILTNVAFIERPFHPTTLVSLARVSLRGRRRQYEARTRLEVLAQGEARLRELNATLEGRVAEALAERKLFADIVATTDASFQALDHDLRFLAINASAVADYRRNFGAEPQVGQTLHEVLAHAPRRLATALQVWRRVLAGESFSETVWWNTPGLPRRAYDMQFRPLLGAQGERIGAYLFGQDVTARMEAQERLAEASAQLHEAQKLETLGQLTGGVAHDFNNLLTPIVGALDLLRTRPGNDARTLRLLDGALQSGERAKTLLQRLLGFARRQSLETRAVDLKALVDGMGDLIRSSIGPGVAFAIHADERLPLALADPNQLELAVLNLCVNARDAMPSGGRLTLEIGQATMAEGEIGGMEAGCYLRLSVVDSGVGMDAETLKRAVEPFYSTKGVGKGTGLGLSMVHGLAGQLRGAFVLSSTPGKGTRADLYLRPAGPELAAEPPRIPREVALPPRPLAILLVDDEDLVRAGAAEMLRDLGHSVTEATGGADALQRLKGGLHVDAIVSDYMMPRIDGAEFARQVRALGVAAPLLVVTGYAGGDLDIGLPTLAKPFRQADLSDALQSLVAASA